MSDKGWVQFLLVAVPVMSLVGSWLALRTVDRLRGRRPPQAGQSEGQSGGGQPGRQSDAAGSESDRA
ncbi:MAG: hypothetical protein JSR42_19285 [Proteobacteria bacterium]|nr:hypothetical protein [Pseudomonadota bacterium]